MQLPTIDITKIPDLEQLTGMYGAMRTPGSGGHDQIVILATVVYESGGGGLI